MHLGSYSRCWARLRPDQPALVFRGRSVSWAEFDAQASALAAAFQQAGAGKGDRIGCLLYNCPEWAVCYAATFKIGAVLVPLNGRYGAGELQQVAQLAECSLVLSRPDLIVKLDPAAEGAGAPAEEVRLYAMHGGVRLLRSFDTLVAAGGEPAPIEAKPDDLALISYTSGSTGLPKGVMLSHAALFAVASSQILLFGWNSEERVLLLAPFAFTGGVVTVYSPSYVVGACVYIEEGLDPQRTLEMMLREKITALTAVPILWDRIAACKEFAGADLSRLRSAVTGGAPVADALLQVYLRKGVSIRQTYGCTEGAGMLCCPSEQYAIEKPSSCGWPLPTVQMLLVDAEDRECAAGERGEILIRGVQVTQGYWCNPAADAESRWKGWFRTGDIGIVDELGQLRIVDRKKNMIITGGVNVYAAEVERVIGTLPGIAEVLVFGRSDPAWGERVVAVVFSPTGVEPEALLRQCREQLGAYKAPKEVIVAPQPLQRTSTGKLPRGDLDRLYASLAAMPRAAVQS